MKSNNGILQYVWVETEDGGEYRSLSVEAIRRLQEETKEATCQQKQN